jgi:KDO2-lipid IV(A) lauroyltransferase
MMIRRAIRRGLLHPLEAAAAFITYAVFKALPLDAASATGGWLGRGIGPRLPFSARATANLARAMPELTPSETAAIVRDMWDNLGRLVAEYPHLHEFQVYGDDGRITVSGVEHVDLLRDDGKPGIFFSAHIGNWEIVSLAASQRGIPLDRIYRAANNRLVEWLYRHGRKAVEGNLIAKGPAGIRPLLKSLGDAKHLGLMVDQKLNDGIPVPFFGRQVMTAPALAELAFKFDCPVVPARVERIEGARFLLHVEPPMEFARTGDRTADVAAAMAQINAVIERWVRDTPEQWLWLHNRWPD